MDEIEPVNEGDWETQVDVLVERAETAGGAEKLALLDEAVRLLDLQHDPRAIYLREELFHAAWWMGQYERAIAEFNIMLAACDKDPDGLGAELTDRLMWLYKWILEHLHKYPQVSRQQIEQTFDDMRRRYGARGLSMRAVHALRSMAALDMGDAALAAAEHEKWLAAEEDGSEDCAACELNTQAEYLLFTGDTRAALERAEPLLKGEMHCSEVPGITQSNFLVPMLQLGMRDAAADAHKKSYRQMRESRQFLGYIGKHLRYLALVPAETTKAAKLLESRLGWALETRNAHDRLYFFLGARLLLARLAASGKSQIKFFLPPEFDRTRDDHTYATQDLADYFLAQCHQIAAAFDQRNATDRYARLVADNEELIALPA